MLCENAYYLTPDDNSSHLGCNNPKKLSEDDLFKQQCPFIYWCTISERFENTTDFMQCKYRGKKNDR